MYLRKLLYYSLGVVLFYLCIVYIFNGQKVIFPVFTISTFFFSMFLSKREMIYSFSLIFIIFIIHLFLPSTVISITIIYVVFIPLTFWLGYYLKNKLWLYKIIYPVILVFIGIYGFSNFWYFINNFNAHQDNDAPEMVFFSKGNSKIRLDTIQDKIIVLDFWTTNCGVCFKKFPEYEKIYLEYKENPKVEVYAINIPIKRDSMGYAKRMIGKYKYQFPKLYAESDSLPKIFGFNGYPHQIILKNRKVRFNGYLNTNKNTFINNIKDEIELLLNEDM